MKSMSESKARLRTVHGGHLQTRFKGGQVRVIHSAGPANPAQSFFSNLEGCIARENPAQGRERCCIKAPVGFLIELSFCESSGSPGPARRRSLRKRSTLQDARGCVDNG